MNNALPPADELVLVDRELAQLDARRSQLLARRAWLLQVLRPPVAAPGAPLSATGPVADSSPRSAQNVLLTLGGVLLTIAALAFTLVSWGSMGIAGRAAVLGVVTSAALAVPVVLLRRGLVSTAESVAALGLVLMVLDAYALHRVALPETDGLGYAAAASAVLAGAWAAYGATLGRLRIPLPVAVVAAQLPLPLAVLAADGGALALGWAALATAAADLAVVLRAKPVGVRTTAGVGAGLLGGWALVTGGGLSLSTAVPAGALLLACAAVALFLAWKAAPAAVAASVVAGLALVAAVGGVLRAVVPGDWEVPGYVLCAVALAAVLRSAVPRAVKRGLVGAGGGVLALGVAWALPPVAAAARPSGADDPGLVGCRPAPRPHRVPVDGPAGPPGRGGGPGGRAAPVGPLRRPRPRVGAPDGPPGVPGPVARPHADPPAPDDHGGALPGGAPRGAGARSPGSGRGRPCRAGAGCRRGRRIRGRGRGAGSDAYRDGWPCRRVRRRSGADRLGSGSGPGGGRPSRSAS